MDAQEENISPLVANWLCRSCAFIQHTQAVFAMGDLFELWQDTTAHQIPLIALLYVYLLDEFGRSLWMYAKNSVYDLCGHRRCFSRDFWPCNGKLLSL